MAPKQVTQVNPSLKTTPLWDHQRKAVDKIRDYLTAYENDNSIGACLVHLPTGAGKTGIIACASHFLSKSGCVLALAPRVALRDQLCREVSGRFFSKMGMSQILPKTVHNVKHGFPAIKDGDYSSSIIAMTIQMLFSMKKKSDIDPAKHKEYATLQTKVNLVL